MTMLIEAAIFQGLHWNVFSDVRGLFVYHFMANALEAGTAVAITGAAIGWFMASCAGRRSPATPWR